MSTLRNPLVSCKPVLLLVLIAVLTAGGSCPSQEGACCVDGACSEMSSQACEAAGGAYLGDGSSCDAADCPAADDLTIFSYAGGDCPPELSVKDGSAGNVECGVRRSRLFDGDSPLEGSMADGDDGEFGFPGADSSSDSGILVRLDDFAVDPSDDRAGIVIICLNITIPANAGNRRAVKCRMKRAAGFELTDEAQAVVDGGRRNYWAKQARKLAKLEADAAGGVDPAAARRADRLRRQFQRKNNDDYDTLADGTRYMAEVEEETEKIEIDPPTPGGTLTLYLVFVGDAFTSLGEFITELDVILAGEPDADSPVLGDTDGIALVLESIDDQGPVAVVDYANGQFAQSDVSIADEDSANARDAIWITNSSTNNLTLDVPDHPQVVLPPDTEAAFDDLGEGGTITGNGSQLNVLTTPSAFACCVDGECQSTFSTEEDCSSAGGTPFLDRNCGDSEACAPVLACCIAGACDDTFFTEAACEDAGGTAFPDSTCQNTPCLGNWVSTLGSYVQEGNCEGDGGTLVLAVIDDLLFLQGLPGNEDIQLVCEGDVAIGSDVNAFGLSGHDITLTIEDNGTLRMVLFQPETFGSCSANLTPQP